MSLQQQFSENYDLCKAAYEKYEKNITHSAVEIAEKLSLEYNDTLRRAFSYFVSTTLEPTRKITDTNDVKVLIYDIETARIEAKLWWTGKQYVGHNQLTTEPRIITIAWKWLGEDKVYHLTWDENQSDEQMIKDFLKVYNLADVIIGQNSDNFDNRFINARAAKFNLDVNVNIRSFDIMKQTKRLFRLPSYSMDYITKFLGIDGKYKHSGIEMWDKIQYGNAEEAKTALKEMVTYNVQDIISTEQMYLRLRKYMGHKIHVGVMNEKEKWTCPNCGSENVELYKTTVTPAGTIQRIMKCKDDGVQYKINNKSYMQFLEYSTTKQ